MKLIILCLDAMSINLVKKFKEDMPNLNFLLENCASAVMKTAYPPMTPAIWVSLQTGKTIGNHGIINFYKYDQNFDVKINSGDNIKEKTFYELLDKAGKKQFLLNIPYTYPWKINGDIVGSWLFQRNELSGLLHPTSLLQKFPKLANYKNYPDRSKGVVNYLKTTFDVLERRVTVIKEVLIKGDYDLYFFLIGSTDWIQHKCYNDLMKGIKNRKTVIAKKVLSDVDELVGFVRNNLGDSNLFIIGDHGFKVYTGKFFVNSWLKNNGYLVTSKGGVGLYDYHGQKKHKFNINLSWIVAFMKKSKFLLKIGEMFYDFVVNKLPFNIIKQPKMDREKSKAYCLSTNERIIYINKNVADKAGLKAEIIDKLNKLDGIKGYDVDDFFKGKYSSSLGDVLVYSEEYEVDNTIGGGEFLEGLEKENHSLGGMFLAFGKDIRKVDLGEVNVVDIAPTILHMFGSSVPLDMDGKVLKDIFKDNSDLKNRTVLKETSEEKKTTEEKDNIKGALKDIKF